MPSTCIPETDRHSDNRLLAISLAALGVMLFASSARAQGHVAFAPGIGTGPLVLRGGTRTGFAHARHARRFFVGPGFAPYSYSEDDSEPGTIEAPQITVLRPAEPAVAPPKPSESVVLELHGDHWVRLTNYGQSQTGESSDLSASDRTSSTLSTPSFLIPRRTLALEPASQLPRAVLIFRDAHQEEIGKYVIVGATIYTSTDYWTSGSWSRKVPIADLDVPATLKLNRERGAKFSLPSGPNEVMMRP
jgi:hypothetical protein